MNFLTVYLLVSLFCVVFAILLDLRKKFFPAFTLLTLGVILIIPAFLLARTSMWRTFALGFTISGVLAFCSGIYCYIKKRGHHL